MRKHCSLVGALTALLTASLLSAHCGESPITPTPPTPPPTQTNNTPPSIQTITVARPRVEADEEVQITAVVQDAETPVSQLTYLWSSSPIAGSFSASAAEVKWRAPKLAITPSLVTLTLTVSEKFLSGGQPKENTVSASAQVHYNDSLSETSKLALDFLKDFTNYSVGPEQCVRNFSDNCPGKAQELGDIQRNREQFEIKGGTFSVSTVTFDSDRTHANIIAPCTFYDTRKDNGKSEIVEGTCKLTSVYENWRWLLCDSNFDWIRTTTNARKNELRFAHP